MANMLWTRPVSENGAQCLGMGEQSFMTLRDQGNPLVITDALKQKVKHIIRENRHFTISEVYEQCPEVSRTFWYEEGISKLVSRYDKCLNVQGDYAEK